MKIFVASLLVGVPFLGAACSESDGGAPAATGGTDAGETGGADPGETGGAGPGGAGETGSGGASAGAPGSGGETGEPDEWLNRYSVAFDGTGHVTLGLREELLEVDQSALSIGLWVKLASDENLSGNGIFSISGSSGFDESFDLFWSTELDEISIAFYGSGGNVRGIVQDPFSWTHVLAVFDGDPSAPRLSLFLDGELAVEEELEQSKPIVGDELWVGQYYSANFIMEGNVDELALWSVPLSAEEASAVFNDGQPFSLLEERGSYAHAEALLGYWRMGDDDSGEGTHVTNLVSSTPATLQGGVSFVEDTP